MDPENQNDSIYSLKVLKGNVSVSGKTQTAPKGQDSFINDLTYPSRTVPPKVMESVKEANISTCQTWKGRGVG